MKLKDKLMKYINVTDDDYIDSAESDYSDDFDFEPAPAPAQESPRASSLFKTEKANSGNVVNINSSKPAQPKPHVVFQKIDHQFAADGILCQRMCKHLLIGARGVTDTEVHVGEHPAPACIQS